MPPSGQVFITRTASFLPNAPVANDDIERVLGQVGDRPSRARRIILRNNGIQQRHYAIDPATGKCTHTNAQLTAEAVRRLADEFFQLNSIDCLATGTSLPDQLMPNHGVMVHGELGNPACEVVSTAGICASGIAALKYAWLAVLAGQAKNAVATGSDRASAVMHARNFAAESQHRVDALDNQPEIAFEKDFLRWMLSDGAGAFLLQPAPRPGQRALRIEWIDILSQAHALPTCMYAGAEKADNGSLSGWAGFSPVDWAQQSIFAVKQDVRLLNEAVVEHTLVKPLEKLMASGRLQASEVDWFLPHMSSAYFRQPMCDAMARIGFAIPPEKWFTNLTTRGNTGAASMFIMIDELLRSGRLAHGQKILCFTPESGRFTGSLMLLSVVDHAG